MTYHKLISIFSAITISIFTSNPAHAKDFKIGSVNQSIPIGSICVVYLPKTQKHMLIIPSTVSKAEPVYAWININGKDARLRQVININRSKMRSISKYQANDITVTIDSRQIEEKQGELLITKTRELISINYQGQTKTIDTIGKCVF